MFFGIDSPTWALDQLNVPPYAGLSYYDQVTAKLQKAGIPADVLDRPGSGDLSGYDLIERPNWTSLRLKAPLAYSKPLFGLS